MALYNQKGVDMPLNKETNQEMTLKKNEIRTPRKKIYKISHLNMSLIKR